MKRTGFKCKPTWKKLERKPFIRKPGKEWKPINRVSKKRRKENAIYDPKRKAFLKERPRCEISGPGCAGASNCIEHTKGRWGKYFLDERYWRAACVGCNGWLETADGKKWGKANGFRPGRIADSDYT